VLPSVERGWSTFKQALRKRPYGRIVERADTVGYRPAVLAIPVQRNNQLSVTEHRRERVRRKALEEEMKKLATSQAMTQESLRAFIESLKQPRNGHDTV